MRTTLFALLTSAFILASPQSSYAAPTLKFKTTGYFQVERWDGTFESVDVSPIIRVTPQKNRSVKVTFKLFDVLYSKVLHWSGDRFLRVSQVYPYQSEFSDLSSCTTSSTAFLRGGNFSLGSTVACKDEYGDPAEHTRTSMVLKIGKAIN